MVINYLLTGMILQVGGYRIPSSPTTRTVRSYEVVVFREMYGCRSVQVMVPWSWNSQCVGEEVNIDVERRETECS